MFHSWDPHFVMKTNPFCYKTVIFEMPGAQLRICGWPIPVTSLSLNSINPPPLHSFIFWKFVEAVPLPLTLSQPAATQHLGMAWESWKNLLFTTIIIATLVACHSIYIALYKPDPTVTFFDASSGKKTASIQAYLSMRLLPKLLKP